ncbi:CPBP family intramembrane glutamic endopeptidase [Litchfieldia alkalitelluris]|uniref:CPBP family intramembrane glutamic endopeptidase n=1 Tax=Litchfieldia alkalitelluris TaxID=304268 RepID=UPI0009983CD4|nr:type II CAAX endopeptidase family protein [Litchfieldia alkalitelluris]
MKLLLNLLGPTIMILIGLHFFGSVPITFLMFYGWLILIPILYKRKNKGFLRKTTMITRDKIWNSLFIGALSGTIFFVFIFGGLFWLHDYFLDIVYVQGILKDWGFTGKAIYGLIFVLLVLNPILEENYWRGFIHQELLIKKIKTGHVILITSFFYTLYHFLSVIPMFQWPLNVVAVLPVFVAGVFWGWIREKTGTLLTPIISHILADLGIMCVYWFIIR